MYDCVFWTKEKDKRTHFYWWNWGSLFIVTQYFFFKRWHNVVPDLCGPSTAFLKYFFCFFLVVERVLVEELYHLLEVMAVEYFVVFEAAEKKSTIIYSYQKEIKEKILFTFLVCNFRFGCRWNISSHDAQNNWLLQCSHLTFGDNEPHKSHFKPSALFTPNMYYIYINININ